MIPTIGGGLTNSGTMPINAGGGAAGDATATARNSIGGITNGAINFSGSAGQRLMQSLPMLLVIAAITFVVVKK
ncbi:hypothetical protein [Vibrio spartinae]|uniref:Uncharacterized protein n=1 Tax=Vibrio spartinae TaxID=1918945 RepID=A0A1N6MBG4_9VIBR|nr:hypothetical protein [Vibrio spartinae]SIO96690.1 hypothetical protein VSP9026_04496 [Vibrio spartinae]